MIYFSSLIDTSFKYDIKNGLLSILSITISKMRLCIYFSIFLGIHIYSRRALIKVWEVVVWVSSVLKEKEYVWGARSCGAKSRVDSPVVVGTWIK
jgi:hypothetical protein